MNGLRDIFNRLLGRGRDSQSVTDGGVVVDGSSGDDGPESAGAGPAETDVEGFEITAERGVDRAETLAGAGFEQVFNATSVPTFILDAEGNVAEWNESIASLTGKAREDAIGHAHVSELFYPDGRRADTLADKVLDAPETADEEYGVERCDSAQTR